MGVDTVKHKNVYVQHRDITKIEKYQAECRHQLRKELLRAKRDRMRFETKDWNE